MNYATTHRLSILAAVLVGLAELSNPADLAGQTRRPPTLREFLLQYKGREVLIIDKTTGVEQFVAGDPSKAYSVTLVDLQSDYMVVTRNTEQDKRSFVYPLSVIRRIIYLFDGKPYDKIVIEMY
jgi:hypothetical protein